MHISGENWTYQEDENGTYLHLSRGENKIAVSIGHPDDTLSDFLKSLIAFFERTEKEKTC